MKKKSNLGRISAKARSQRRRRKEETVEETRERLAKQAERTKRSRTRETLEQTQARLAKQAERTKRNRARKALEKIQIQERFTWTRKNFGMDRFMVTNIISKNCPNSICKQNIETVVPNREQNFMQDVVTPMESHLQTVLKQYPSASNNNAACLNPAMSMYAWPVMFPVPNRDKRVPYTFPNTNHHIHEKCNNPCYENQSKSIDINKRQPDQSQKHCQLYDMKRQLRSVPGTKVFGSSSTFRKPKYIYEFKALVSAAEKLTSAYPSILNEPKTKFLGSLGLVPKKICSKKTLSKFEREKKKKKTHEKQHMFYYKHRKNLRDRNKLNKIKQKEQQQKPSYLDVSKARRNRFSFEEEHSHDETANETEVEDVSRDSDVEILEVVPKSKPEIILISSSEDEKCSSSVPSRSSENKIGITITHPSFDGGIGKTIEHYKSPYSEMNQKGSFVNKISIKKTIDGSYTAKMSTSSDSKQTSAGACNVQSFSKNPIIFPYKSKTPILPSPLAPLSCLKPPEMPANFKGYANTKAPEMFSNKNISMLQSSGKANIVAVKKERQDFSNFYSVPRLPADTSIYLVEKSVFDRPDTLLPGSSVLQKSIDGRNFRAPNEASIISNGKLFTSNSGTSKTWKKIVSHSNVRSPQQILRFRRRLFSEEMSRFVWWIRKTKMSVMHTLTHNNIERSTLRLKSQLNTGIALVKNLRRRLIEIENLEAIYRTDKLQNYNYLDGHAEKF